MARKARADTPLTRDKVLHVAIDLADAGGIAALSMRTLGRQLGVEAMSLYNHVSSKDDLLDGIVDLVIAEIELPAPDADWRDAMRARAVAARAAFARHPWAAGLIDSRVSSGPGRLRYLDSIIGVLRRAGFTIELALRAFSLIDSYIYGFGRQSLNIASSDGGEVPAAEAFAQALPADDFPYLAEMATTYAASPGYDAAADFAFGLELILDGLQRVLDSTQSPARPWEAQNS
ncbi:MAG: TetR/AcrR family transcriptional regulator [Chloroflexales bacterium]|nr:TetR/AcrR family transcriptional regulator [Chloroflexales bacterium]